MYSDLLAFKEQLLKKNTVHERIYAYRKCHQDYHLDVFHCLKNYVQFLISQNAIQVSTTLGLKAETNLGDLARNTPRLDVVPR